MDSRHTEGLSNGDVAAGVIYQQIAMMISTEDYENAFAMIDARSSRLSIDEQLSLVELILNKCVQVEDYTTAVEAGLIGSDLARSRMQVDWLVEFLVRLGSVQSVIGQHSQALSSFSEAIITSPNHAIDNEAYYRAGAEAYILGDYQQAANYFSPTLPTHLDQKEWVRINTLRGDTFARIGEFDKAGRIYTETLERAMSFPDEVLKGIAQGLKKRVVWLMNQRDLRR